MTEFSDRDREIASEALTAWIDKWERVGSSLEAGKELVDIVARAVAKGRSEERYEWNTVGRLGKDI
jgi:hypothetical protein